MTDYSEHQLISINRRLMEIRARVPGFWKIFFGVFFGVALGAVAAAAIIAVLALLFAVPLTM